MEKQQLLAELSEKIQSGEISREEVFELADTGERKKKHHVSVTKILYFLGSAVVVLGILFFVAQIWEEIGSFGRIAITLGLGLVFAGIGSHFLIKEPERHLGTVFHVIGGLLVPGGAMVTLSELSTGVVTLWPVTFTIGIIFAFYALLAVYHKNVALSFFAIANGTAFVYLLVESILDEPFYRHDDLIAYLTMVLGLSYLFLGKSFKETWNNQLVGVLNFFGAIAFLGAAFSRVFDSGFFELLFFLFAFGGVALAIQLKSKAILIVSTLFLIAHFSYITSEYFANSIGWPLSLIILGFVFIGLGYSSIKLNKKYM